jgi:hypothetical protein
MRRDGLRDGVFLVLALVATWSGVLLLAPR